MGKKLKFKKISFKDRLRWFFLGKLPLERKYKPKILEYLFNIFSNILILIIQIVFLYMYLKIVNEKNDNLNAVNILLVLKKFEFRVLLSIFILSWLVQVFMFMHIMYILSKTEFNKWIGIIGGITGILLLSPLSILFNIVAYQKNELAFE
ncbi:hypothetical protein NW066_00225 [Mycoplasmopsis felis]|uniref:hypothetical protein n=1 Tax=Mycoplasmopsis felis TaxID=33923 RepID=UPI0021AFB4B0|nr:hypothetical protein [Mycoplasmopsis felis]UWV85186.1 hypothetical protein NW066_00225 [Mycoplasmopsis felis]